MSRRGRQAEVIDWTPIMSRDDRNALNNPQRFKPKYKKLGELVLNDKHDIRFSANAANTATADAFAAKRKLKAKVADINGDDEDDVVLYNKHGNPVYINGYYFTPSEFKLREQYHTDFPTPQDKATIGGYSNFKKKFWKVPEYRARANEYAESVRDTGYFVPKQPKVLDTDNKSIYQIWSSMVIGPCTEMIKAYINNVDWRKSNVISVLSPVSFCANIYIDVLLRALWYTYMDSSEALISVKSDIMRASDDPFVRYKLFTKYIGKNKDAINTAMQQLWQSQVIPYINDTEYMSQKLGEVDFTPDLINGMPTDTEIKQNYQARAAKIATKNHINQLLKEQKDASIENVFGQIMPSDDEA